MAGSFVLGVIWEHGSVTAAREAQAQCAAKFEAAVHASAQDQGVLDLYRAAAEISKSNFGNGADFLGKARGALSDTKNAKTLAEIDAALDAAKKNDKAASDHTQAAIALVESH
ncbi:MAG TPA: hypothetical protein VMV18_11570 [bacterium]|nr:hypothetical protein [bacterium]